MHVKLKNDGKRGSYYVEVEGKILAQMTFTWAGMHQIIIDHTEVDEQLQGKGAGRQMVFEAVNEARNKHFKIIPLCPFAKSVFDRNPAIGDVLR